MLRRTFAAFLALLLLTLIGGASVTTNNSTNDLTSMQSQPSQRDRNGLRGPVKICIEDKTFPALTTVDGKQSPGTKSTNKTQYGLSGHIEVMSWLNPDGSEYITHYTYSSSGLLLNLASGKKGEPASTTDYHYDK